MIFAIWGLLFKGLEKGGGGGFFGGVGYKAREGGGGGEWIDCRCSVLGNPFFFFLDINT